MPADDNKPKGRLRFELEEDAEELFRKALENIDPSVKREEPEEDAPGRAPAKVASPVSLDLHGMTLAEAEAAVDRLLTSLIQGPGGVAEVTFITGKGRHSGPGGSVLPRGVHHHVKSKWAPYIEQIDSSPADAHIGGIPIRGHFSAKFRW